MFYSEFKKSLEAYFRDLGVRTQVMQVPYHCDSSECVCLVFNEDIKNTFKGASKESIENAYHSIQCIEDGVCDFLYSNIKIENIDAKDWAFKNVKYIYSEDMHQWYMVFKNLDKDNLDIYDISWWK